MAASGTCGSRRCLNEALNCHALMLLAAGQHSNALKSFRKIHLPSCDPQLKHCVMVNQGVLQSVLGEQQEGVRLLQLGLEVARSSEQKVILRHNLDNAKRCHRREFKELTIEDRLGVFYMYTLGASEPPSVGPSPPPSMAPSQQDTVSPSPRVDERDESEDGGADNACDLSMLADPIQPAVRQPSVEPPVYAGGSASSSPTSSPVKEDRCWVQVPPEHSTTNSHPANVGSLTFNATFRGYTSMPPFTNAGGMTMVDHATTRWLPFTWQTQDDALASLTVSELKQMLRSFGVSDLSTFFEKSDLVDKCRELMTSTTVASAPTAVHPGSVATEYVSLLEVLDSVRSESTLTSWSLVRSVIRQALLAIKVLPLGTTCPSLQLDSIFLKREGSVPVAARQLYFVPSESLEKDLTRGAAKFIESVLENVKVLLVDQKSQMKALNRLWWQVKYDVLDWDMIVDAMDDITTADTTSSAILLEDRLGLIREYFAAASANHPTLNISVSRSGCLHEVSYLFTTSTHSDILRPFNVKFHGETAVDGGTGGLVAELFDEFVQRLCELWRDRPRYITPEQGRALGGIIAKSVVDGRRFAFPGFHAVHWDMLLGSALQDAMSCSAAFSKLTTEIPRGDLWSLLHALDKTACLSLSHVARCDTHDLNELHLHNNSGQKVTTEASRMDYVKEQLLSLCFSKERKLALVDIAEGVRRYLLPSVPPTLRRLALNAVAIRAIVSDVDFGCPADGGSVVKHLEFRGWESDDGTPYFLCVWLHEATTIQRRQFLKLCTSSAALPVDAKRRITVYKSESSFSARTCFCQLNLPPYASLAELTAAFEVAFLSLAADPAMAEAPTEE